MTNWSMSGSYQGNETTDNPPPHPSPRQWGSYWPLVMKDTVDSPRPDIWEMLLVMLPCLWRNGPDEYRRLVNKLRLLCTVSTVDKTIQWSTMSTSITYSFQIKLHSDYHSLLYRLSSLSYWTLIKNATLAWFYLILTYMDGFSISEGKLVVPWDFDRWDMFERLVDKRL